MAMPSAIAHERGEVADAVRTGGEVRPRCDLLPFHESRALRSPWTNVEQTRTHVNSIQGSVMGFSATTKYATVSVESAAIDSSWNHELRLDSF